MAVSSNVLNATTVHELLSEDQSRLLDTIDELRTQGVGKLLGDAGLPQLIVCGDQSSGKSSVLEALTRVRFPTKTTTCTTFATELRLRREPRSRISCKIKAAATRSPEEIEQLGRFSASLDTPEDFPNLVAAARECMRNAGNSVASEFFNDVLQVEIDGPELAPLTIVDLPGLIHYQKNSMGDQNVRLVTNLVQSYMKQSNSIILAILSAHNDIDNQIVLRHIKSIVANGQRTLGIITKPDELPAGSEKEQEYIDHARTNPDKFQYGWHVVRNRSYGERESSFDDRDEKEKDFFLESNWAPLEGRDVGLGVTTLREKLSKMLLDHIGLSLPAIVKRLEMDLERSQNELTKLGDPRTSPQEQTRYLSDICDNFGLYTKDALDGRYHDISFFGSPSSSDGLQRRLRAKVRNLNDEFASKMLKQGHRWHIVEDSDFATSVFRFEERADIIKRSTFIKQHVDVLAQLERGNELSGISNPLLVGSLFRQQSEPWQGIAATHLDNVWGAVKGFLELLLNHLTDERTCNQLLVNVIDPALEARHLAIKGKLEELLIPHRAYDPINIEPHFARKIWSVREQRIARPIAEAIRDQFGDASTDSKPSVDEIVAKITATNALIDDKYGSNESLEFMQAYYDTTILNFINNVAALAVEQCLLSGLPRIFSSGTIREMSEETLSQVAAESREVITERKRLTDRVGVLRKGLRTIRLVQPAIRLGQQPATPNLAAKSQHPASAQAVFPVSKSSGDAVFGVSNQSLTTSARSLAAKSPFSSSSLGTSLPTTSPETFSGATSETGFPGKLPFQKTATPTSNFFGESPSKSFNFSSTPVGTPKHSSAYRAKVHLPPAPGGTEKV